MTVIHESDVLVRRVLPRDVSFVCRRRSEVGENQVCQQDLCSLFVSVRRSPDHLLLFSLARVVINALTDDERVNASSKVETTGRSHIDNSLGREAWKPLNASEENNIVEASTLTSNLK